MMPTGNSGQANVSTWRYDQPVIVVTGAGSGIGKEFVKQLLLYYPHTRILGLDLNFTAEKVPYHGGWIDENKLMLHRETYCSREQQRLEEHVIDITSEVDVQKITARLHGVPIQLIVHCAGIRGLVKPEEISSYEEIAKTESLETMDATTLRRTLDVNTVGTFMLLRALVPSLQHAVTSHRPEEDVKTPTVMLMGSRMGSIANNSSTGGGYAYRASKAALNAIVKSFSVDVPEVIWLIVHPGRLETGLVPIKEDGAEPVEQAVTRMIQMSRNLTLNDSGKFIDRYGVEIPW